MPTMSRADARRRLAQARVGRLATVGPEGQPHLVPIVFAAVDDTVYSAVDRKPKSSGELRRVRNIRANAQVSLLMDHYEEDWTRLWWVRADGCASVLNEVTGSHPAVDALTAKYRQYAGSMLGGPVIAVRVTRLRGWTAA